MVRYEVTSFLCTSLTGSMVTQAVVALYFHCNVRCRFLSTTIFFLQIVESYDEEQKARLLQFVTGSSRVPLEGFKALQGNLISCSK